MHSGRESVSSVCLPSLLPHYKSTETGGGTGSGEIDFNRSPMAITTLVSAPFIKGHSSTHSTSQVTLSTNKSSGGNSSFITKLLSRPNGLASVRDRLSGERVLASSSSAHVERGQRRIMNRPGISGFCGVMEGVWMPLLSL